MVLKPNVLRITTILLNETMQFNYIYLSIMILLVRMACITIATLVEVKSTKEFYIVILGACYFQFSRFCKLILEYIGLTKHYVACAVRD